MLVRMVHGSATALFGPTAAAALSDLAPPDARGRWLGTYAAIQGAGQAAGPVIAGVLLAAFGFPVTFAAAGAIGLVAWALVARGVPAAAAGLAFSMSQTRAAVAIVGFAVLSRGWRTRA